MLLRITAGLVVALVLLFAGVRLFYAFYVNPNVSEELRNAPESARAQKVMLLTLPDGRTIPVNYLREGDFVYAGADGRWWRTLRGEGGPVTALIRGETLRGHGRAITDDPERTRDVFSRLRPAVPAWLPDWLDGVLVAIELEPAAAPTS